MRILLSDFSIIIWLYFVQYSFSFFFWKLEKKGTLVINFIKENLSNLFSIQHPRMGVFQHWESAECFVMVWIKSIHNIGYKTAFYTSLYLLLSDSIQNILITFEPEITSPVSFKGQNCAISQYVKNFLIPCFYMCFV